MLLKSMLKKLKPVKTKQMMMEMVESISLMILGVLPQMMRVKTHLRSFLSVRMDSIMIKIYERTFLMMWGVKAPPTKMKSIYVVKGFP